MFIGHKNQSELNNGKPVTIGYGLISGRNETKYLLSILIIYLVSIYAAHVEINRRIQNDIDIKKMQF